MGEEVYLVVWSAWVIGSHVWTYAETNISPRQLVETALEALPKIFEDQLSKRGYGRGPRGLHCFCL